MGIRPRFRERFTHEAVQPVLARHGDTGGGVFEGSAYDSIAELIARILPLLMMSTADLSRAV